MAQISHAIRCLWAKKAVIKGTMQWLPLSIHLKDAAEAAQKIWHRWLPEGVRQSIALDLGGEVQAKKLLLFLAAAHDLGKGTPVFQSKKARPPQRELDEFIENQLIMAGVPVKDEMDLYQ